MNRERLTILRDHLRDNVKDEKFNLAYWVGNDSVPWLGHMDLSCGTTACAMGHGATIPEFQKLGLGLRQTYDGSNIGVITFGEKEHFEAAADFMGLSLNEAHHLFDPDCYDDQEETSRQTVVERITDFMRDGLPADFYGNYSDDEEDDYEEEDPYSYPDPDPYPDPDDQEYEDEDE